MTVSKRVQLLYFAGCPNHVGARELVERVAAESHAPRAKGSHPSILSGTRSRAIGFVGLLPIRAGSDRDAAGAFLGCEDCARTVGTEPVQKPLDQGEVETADEARVTGG